MKYFLVLSLFSLVVNGLDNNTSDPTMITISPTMEPTLNTMNPTLITINPTMQPSLNTINPTINPSMNPVFKPTTNPVLNPSNNPTVNPVLNPSNYPSNNPVINPTSNPTIPTTTPVLNPTNQPSINTTNPTINPTMQPTINTMNPSMNPIFNPTTNPVLNPSNNPTVNPVLNPSNYPSNNPVFNPTSNPTTLNPTTHPVSTNRVQPLYPNSKITSTSGGAKCNDDHNTVYAPNPNNNAGYFNHRFSFTKDTSVVYSTVVPFRMDSCNPVGYPVNGYVKYNCTADKMKAIKTIYSDGECQNSISSTTYYINQTTKQNIDGFECPDIYEEVPFLTLEIDIQSDANKPKCKVDNDTGVTDDTYFYLAVVPGVCFNASETNDQSMFNRYYGIQQSGTMKGDMYFGQLQNFTDKNCENSVSQQLNMEDMCDSVQVKKPMINFSFAIINASERVTGCGTGSGCVNHTAFLVIVLCFMLWMFV